MLALLAAPWVLPEYWLAQLTFILIYSVVGLGLMLLVGLHRPVLARPRRLPRRRRVHRGGAASARACRFPLALARPRLVSAAVGVVVGLPALRVKGIYLAIATLAFGFIVVEVFARWESVTGGNAGKHVKAPRACSAGAADTDVSFYFICLGRRRAARPSPSSTCCARRPAAPSSPSATRRSRRRAWASTSRATRRSRSRISAALAGVGGALYAHKLKFISPDQFDILQSIDLLLMIVVGGIGSVHGAFLGAIFLITMPQAIALAKDYLPAAIGQAPGLQGAVYGLVLIAFVLFEPLGLYGRWLKLRTYFQIFPFYRKGMFKRQKSFLKSDRLK